MKLSNTLLFIAVYYSFFLSFCRSNFVSNNLSIRVFDVGQGDAILIDVYGKKILIDGGANFEVDYKLNKYVPFWDCNLTALILTHPHYDHLAGLNRVLERCRVQQVMFNDVNYSSYEFDLFKEKVAKLNVKSITAGDKFEINNVLFEVLWPTKEFLDSRIENINNVSVVMVMKYEDFNALFLGDLERKIDLPRAEYVKIAHHGASNGVKPEIEPGDICVISVGEDNRFGHPHEETLKYLKENDCEVLRTDEMGDISIKIKGALSN